jgi:hypothetical protein
VGIRDEGLCRVGWSTRSAKLDLGTDKNGFGYGGRKIPRKFIDSQVLGKNLIIEILRHMVNLLEREISLVVI